MENKKVEFETYLEFDNYYIKSLTINKPSAINTVGFRKYKVTIELIEETTEVLILRLIELKNNTKNYNEIDKINIELKKLGCAG